MVPDFLRYSSALVESRIILDMVLVRTLLFFRIVLHKLAKLKGATLMFFSVSTIRARIILTILRTICIYDL